MARTASRFDPRGAFVLALLVGGLATPASGQTCPQPCVPCPCGNASPQPGVADRSLEDLIFRTSADELVALYRQAPVGTIPQGFLPGEAILLPNSPVQRLTLPITRFLWQGKVFRANGTVSNIVLLPRMRAVPAVHSIGASWQDGRPTQILDYAGNSFLFPYLRDELREIRPNLYLGIAYRRPSFTGRPVGFAFFLLRGPGVPTRL